MTSMTRLTVGACALAVLFTASFAVAQAPQMVRVRGTIEKVDGSTLTVKSRDGVDLTVKLADNGPVRAVLKASLADIKVGSYLAITGMPQPDGSQKAMVVFIFPEGVHPPEGFSKWDFNADSTMTNATVDNAVTGVDGQVLTVKYKDGEQKITVPASAEIVTFKPATIADVMAGQKIFIVAARKLPDGTLEAPNIAVGDYGVWR
jgi:hypothetical protein